MVQKGKLAVFESTSISKTVKTTPTKIDAHVCYINPYMHDFLSRFQSINFFDDHGLYLLHPLLLSLSIVAGQNEAGQWVWPLYTYVVTIIR